MAKGGASTSVGRGKGKMKVPGGGKGRYAKNIGKAKSFKKKKR